MKILIVDDSVVYRSQIRAAISSIENVEIVGSVSNGKLAVEFLCKKSVDLVILDLEMPELSGIDTIRSISDKKIQTKILVFSSFSKKGAEITLEALKLGAWDFVAKPNASVVNKLPAELIKDVLEGKIRSLQSIRNEKLNIVPLNKYTQVDLDKFQPEIVVIGSSTGGPTVLEKIFSNFKGRLLYPILIAQHMPPIFTEALAARLSKLCNLRVQEGTDGLCLEQGSIYIAPGDYHMTLRGTKTKPVIEIKKTDPVNFVRPAVDPLFTSVAEIYKSSTLGIVLTGMGTDGLAGSIDIKKRNGAVCIQSEESCVVFGMPGAVSRACAYDKSLSPQEISKYLMRKVFSESRKVEGVA